VIVLLNYIKKNENHTIDVSVDNEIKCHDTTFQKVLSPYLKGQFTTLEAREKSVKRTFGYDSKIPLYVNDLILLLCIKSYRLEESFYINYHAIRSYQVKTSSILIEFHTNQSMKLFQKRPFLRQIRRCQEILNFLKNQKMFSCRK